MARAERFEVARNYECGTCFAKISEGDEAGYTDDGDGICCWSCCDEYDEDDQS